jgi:hypothetical protein
MTHGGNFRPYILMNKLTFGILYSHKKIGYIKCVEIVDPGWVIVKLICILQVEMG